MVYRKFTAPPYDMGTKISKKFMKTVSYKLQANGKLAPCP